MRTLEIGETRTGSRGVIVAPDSPELIFVGVDMGALGGGGRHKNRLKSAWIRLTGPNINEASVEDIEEGRILDEWLPRPGSESGKLAVAANVVVAFPAHIAPPTLELPSWKFIPGPVTASLFEAQAPKPRVGTLT